MCLKAISKLFTVVITCALLTGGQVHAEEVYDVPTNSSFKAYMSYKAITNKDSKQYKLQQNCVTTEEGLRTYNGYYTVAVGTGFGASVGDYIDVELSSGRILHCVIGDMKQNRHTDATNRQVAHNGNVVEFIVDTGALEKGALSSGDISDIDGFEGYIKTITVFGEEDTKSLNWEKVNKETKSKPKYLILAKYETPLPNGDSLYTVEYAFDSDFNSVIVDEDFYNNVEVGNSVVTF